MTENMDSILTFKGDLTAQCMAFGEILGLNEPVPEAVLKGALADHAYAHNLLASRGAGPFLSHLLTSPPVPADTGATPEPGTGAMIKSAGVSLARWARTGFTFVDDEVRAGRQAACAVCPHLQSAARTPAQKLASIGLGEKAHCGKCGCSIARKTRMSSESCPDAAPDMSGLTRWGDPLSEAE